MQLKRALLAVLCSLLAFAAMPARAQTFPDKPIKLIVPFPAGGGGDVLARLVTQFMSEDLGQQVVIINQNGAGGALAFAQAARSEPDGYTLVWTSVSFPVVAATMEQLQFNAATDFTHIGGIAENPFILVLHPDVPAKNVAELIALAKAKPKALNLAHNGTGTLTKLALDLLQLQTGIDVTEVSYRGDNFSIADVIAGHVQGMFSNSPVALQHIPGGRVRALAVTSPKRSSAAPDLPTMAEAGVPDFQVVIWHGLSGPAKMPRPIVDRLNKALKAALTKPEVVERFKTFGVDAVGSSPEDYTAQVNKELVLWSSVAKRAAAAGK